VEVAASLVQMYSHYPLVLVQLYLGNDELDAAQALYYVCSMVWPRDRVVVQVGV
jgi:hypothetical protein